GASIARGVGGGQQLLLALNRAGARHHDDLGAAHADIARRRRYAYDGGFRMELPTRQLVGLGDRQRRFDAGKTFELRAKLWRESAKRVGDAGRADGPEDANDGALDPTRDMGCQPAFAQGSDQAG